MGDDLTVDQQRELQEVLNNFQDVMRDEPGLMKNMVHKIHTGDSTPCRTLPYCICPTWREALRKEIQKLREAGIIEPSNSP